MSKPTTFAEMKVRVVEVLRAAPKGMTHEEVEAAVGPVIGTDGTELPDGDKVKSFFVAAAIDKLIDIGIRSERPDFDATLSCYPIFQRGLGKDHRLHAHLRVADIPWRITEAGDFVACVMLGAYMPTLATLTARRVDVGNLVFWRAEVGSVRYSMSCPYCVDDVLYALPELAMREMAAYMLRNEGGANSGGIVVTDADLWAELDRLAAASDACPARADEMRSAAAKKREEAAAVLKAAEEEAAALRERADDYEDDARDAAAAPTRIAARMAELATILRAKD